MLPLDRMKVRSAWIRLSRWLTSELIDAPLEFILHPSAPRLGSAAFSVLLGNLLFYLLWTFVFPQPYENAQVRTVMALLGLIYLLPFLRRESASRRSAWTYSITCWLTLPAFFFWMYLMNVGNAVWLASVSAMLLIYYQLTDWRLATLGSASGLLVAFLLVEVMDLTVAQSVDYAGPNRVVLGFAWSAAIMLGASSANLRRARLINMLSTMGVMAHELRTPLATVNLMGDVLRNLVQSDLPESKRRKIDELATRLQNLVRTMNRQIDTQISNAQLQRLPRERSLIQAGELVQEVVVGYPFRSSRERDCLQVQIQQDFCFCASRQLFAQVLANLIKNALHSLASAGTAPQPGDLRIRVDVHQGKGRIAVADEGVGIPHDRQARIFEPFYSTQSGAGSGLGLTFCKNVLDTVNGQITVQSEPAVGATFVLDLPLDTRGCT